MHKPEASEKVRTEAADWVVRLDAPDCSEADRNDFLDWLAASAEHAPAFSRAQQLWCELDNVAALPVSGRAPRRDAIPDRYTASAGRHRRRSRGFRRIAAAAILLLAVGCGALFGDDARIALRADASSTVGETRTLTLEDGSRIQLNTDSAVAVHYGTGTREIELLKGEAAFEVAHDASRPFRVHAAGGTVTALGTVFLVRDLAGGARVAVTEGRVEVRAGSAIAELGAGQQAAYLEGEIAPAIGIDSYAASAWRRGRISFVDQPLGEVVAELNRYHRGRIVVADDLAALPVSGAFETTQPLAAVAALEQTLGLHSRRYTDFLILLRR